MREDGTMMRTPELQEMAREFDLCFITIHDLQNYLRRYENHMQQVAAAKLPTSYGEFKLSGSIFLDYSNDKNYQDEYSLIYGHHMDRNTMFGALDYFLDRTYFNDHSQGTLTTADGVYDIDLFAVSGADGTDPTIFSPHGRTTEEIIAYIEENADIYTGYEAGKPILALSTCYGETAESRLVVFGTLTRR